MYLHVQSARVSLNTLDETVKQEGYFQISGSSLIGHEFEQTLGDSGGQGSLACCTSWGHKELDMTL